MAFLLHIETSSPVCSVAISKDEKLLAIRESFEDKSHAALLTLFIEELFKETQLSAHQLNAICVSKGPGSYTGLRIGVSTAKGICYAAEKPLIAIESLEALAAGFLKKNVFTEKEFLLCPMMDARRMEVYTAVYNQKMNLIEKTNAKIIDEHSFQDILDDNIVYFFGDGSEKCKSTIQHKNARFVPNITNSSEYMISLAIAKYNKQKFEDIAYFEPFYLKDFVAIKSKKKLF